MPSASRVAPRSAHLLLWGDVQDAQALRQVRARLVTALKRCPPFARRRAYLEIRLAEVTARLIAAELEAGRDLILRRD